MTYLIRDGGVRFVVDVVEQGGRYRVRVGAEGETAKEYDVGWAAALGRSHRTLEWHGGRTLIVVDPEGATLGVTVGIDHFDLQVETARALRVRPSSREPGAEMVELRAPMPGLIVAVEAEPGQPVAAGGTVAVIEAMKMQMELRAPVAGTLRQINALPGQEVGAGEVIAVLHPNVSEPAGP